MVAYLHNNRTDIYLLQETHSVLRVSILFSPICHVTIIRSMASASGRFLICDFELSYRIFTLVSLNGPNLDDPVFSNDIFLHLQTFASDSLIIGGDFNSVLNLDCRLTRGLT